MWTCMELKERKENLIYNFFFCYSCMLQGAVLNKQNVLQDK